MTLANPHAYNFLQSFTHCAHGQSYARNSAHWGPHAGVAKVISVSIMNEEYFLNFPYNLRISPLVLVMVLIVVGFTLKNQSKLISLQ